MRGLTKFQRNTVISIAFFMLMILLAPIVDRHLSLWMKETVSEVAAGINLTVGTDDLSVHAFRFNPRVDIQGLKVAAVGQEPLLVHADVSIKFSWWGLATGLSSVQNVRVDALQINLLVDDHGLDNGKNVVKSLLSLHSDTSLGIMIEQFDISEGQLEYINDELLHSGTFTLDGKWKIDGKAAESELNLSGDVNSLPVTLKATIEAELSGNWGGSVSAEGKLGELNLLANAKVGDIHTLANAQLDLDLQGRNLKTILQRLSLGHTNVSDIAFKVSSHYQKSNDTGTADIHLTLDNSVADGQLIIEGLGDSGQTKRIRGALNAQSIFMDAILGPSSKGERTKSVKPESPAGVFSRAPITSLDVLSNVDIDLDVSINTLYTGSLRVNDLSLSLKKSGNETQLKIDSNDFGQGKFKGNLSLKTDDRGIKGKFYAQAKRVPIHELMTLSDMPDGVASGKLSGDAKFWVSGNSMAELASSLDGGLFMVIEEGKLDSLWVEMAGFDFMESIRLVMKRDLQQTDIRCGYMDIQANSGLLTVKDFIIDTEDSVFLLSGQINLIRETIDLKLSPLPRDSSFFAATTPINIVGSLAFPKFRPGGKLYVRLALAAAMVALAGPATIVLPFIEVGDGDETSYCSELFGQ